MMTKMTHGNPPRTGGAAAFLGRADLILAITLRLAHPLPARNIGESGNSSKKFESSDSSTLPFLLKSTAQGFRDKIAQHLHEPPNHPQIPRRRASCRRTPGPGSPEGPSPRG